MENNELITGKNERVVSFFKAIDRMLDGIENLVRSHKPTLGGERYMNDKEVAARLRVSRRNTTMPRRHRNRPERPRKHTAPLSSGSDKQGR